MNRRLNNETDADAADPEAVLDPVEQHMQITPTR